MAVFCPFPDFSRSGREIFLPTRISRSSFGEMSGHRQDRSARPMSCAMTIENGSFFISLRDLGLIPSVAFFQRKLKSGSVNFQFIYLIAKIQRELRHECCLSNSCFPRQYGQFSSSEAFHDSVQRLKSFELKA